MGQIMNVQTQDSKGLQLQQHLQCKEQLYHLTK